MLTEEVNTILRGALLAHKMLVVGNPSLTDEEKQKFADEYDKAMDWLDAQSTPPVVQGLTDKQRHAIGHLLMVAEYLETVDTWHYRVVKNFLDAQPTILPHLEQVEQGYEYVCGCAACREPDNWMFVLRAYGNLIQLYMADDPDCDMTLVGHIKLPQGVMLAREREEADNE